VNREVGVAWSADCSTATMSAVDFTAVARAENENQQPVVCDLANEPVIADAILPILNQFGPVQNLTDTARILERSQPMLANASLGAAHVASSPRGGSPGTPQVSEHPQRKQNQKGYKGHFRATETVPDDPARV
jgi:hypothetical protein